MTVKSEQQVRLECLNAAMMLASSKQITPDAVVPYAMEFFRWVSGATITAREMNVAVDNLAEKFRSRTYTR